MHKIKIVNPSADPKYSADHDQLANMFAVRTSLMCSKQFRTLDGAVF